MTSEAWLTPSILAGLLALLVVLSLSPIAVSMRGLASGKDWSEVVKNVVESLAVLGGVCAAIKWIYERKDRATDILLKLEQDCFDKNTREGRLLVEDDTQYDDAKESLRKAVDWRDGKAYPSTVHLEPDEARRLASVDNLLRFYVVLHGVRLARQVPDASLSTCYRFWLGHYFHPGRIEFKNYVDAYYPTLRVWLSKDVKERDRFFRPEDFPWPRR